MANIYLDTNKFIDAISRNTDLRKKLNGHSIFISPLSVHIFSYLEKIKIPNEKLNSFIDLLTLVPLTSLILAKSLQGPTNDLEDNIQLHSAVEVDCDIFLTNDKKLLKMKFFGKTKIVDALT